MSIDRYLTLLALVAGLCLAIGIGLTGSAAAQGNFNQTVGVVDDDPQGYGGFVKDFLEGPNGLPDHYDVQVVNSSHPLENQAFDVYVVQNLGQEHRSQFIEIANHSDIGVVYLDQRRYSNGIEALSAETGDPATVSEGFYGTESNHYTQTYHPITDSWGPGVNISIISGQGDRTWFSGTNVSVIASATNDSGGLDGPTLAVDDNRSLVLAGGLGVSPGTAAYFTPDGKQLLANTVEYANQDQTIGVVDDYGAYGQQVVTALENTPAVPNSVSVELVSGTHPVDEEPHDAYVVQHLSDANRSAFITATEGLDIGVVYLDNVGPSANGIAQRAEMLSSPNSVNVTGGPDINYQNIGDHPVFAGWSSGTDIPIATNVSSGTQYMVGDPSVGTLATLGLGTGFAIDEDRADILATSMARSGNVSNANFTPDANKLLGQAVGYVANRPPDIDLTTIKYPDSSAQLNESIELTVNISNTGGSSAISAANLLINGTPDADQVLELSPGDKVSIPFSTKATLDMIPSVTVEAGYAGVQSYRNVVSVYPPTLDRINLTLANNSILRGGYTFSNVIATYETGYSPAVDEHVDTWSANTSVATIANGTVIGEGAGSTRIFAEFDDGTNSDIDYTTVTVTEAPKKSLLLISSTSLFVDQTRTPRAFLTYETPIIDNVTDKVTFSSNNSSVLSVNDNIITGMSPGQANLTATLDANQSINTTKTFTVSEPDLLYLDVVLGSASLRAPETTSAQVIGNYQAGITRDVTANATILSFNETVATVNGSTVRSKAAGETEIYAEFDGQFNTSVVNVTEPDVQSLALEAPASMVINDTGPVTVNATDSQGNVSNVSQNATITSSNTSVITVDNATLEAVGAGNATITASYAGTSATATVAVTPVGPPTYEMSIPNDGGIYSLGFPAAINGSLAAAFPNGYDGLSAVYRYDNGWTQINDFANTSVDPLDTIVLTTRGNAGPAEIGLAVPLQTGSSLSTRSVSAGWQYIAAPAFTDAESAFGGSIDPSVTIIDRYGGPSSSEFQSVSPFAFYQFGSYQWGVTPPAVSPFKGYFVYFQNSATVPVVVSDLESKSDADFRLGVE